MSLSKAYRPPVSALLQLCENPMNLARLQIARPGPVKHLRSQAG